MSCVYDKQNGIFKFDTLTNLLADTAICAVRNRKATANDTVGSLYTSNSIAWVNAKATQDMPILPGTTPADEKMNAMAASLLGHDASLTTLSALAVKSRTAAPAQAVTVATRTYLTNSNVQLAAGGLKVGSRIRWTVFMTKTAAGTAAANVGIAFGTAGTTADTDRVTLTRAAGTAAADVGKMIIDLIVTAVGASGVVFGSLSTTHQQGATGFLTTACHEIQASSSAFDTTTVTNIGLTMTGGASEAVTVAAVGVETWNI